MDKQQVLLEQYKLFVQTADDITVRRLQTNKFYLTILLGLFMVAGFLNKNNMISIVDEKLILILISVIGIGLSIIWYMNIESYRLLSSAKFKVIHDMETNFDYHCFEKEWKYRKEGNLSKAYPRFTQIEKFVPIMIGIIYFIIFVVGVYFIY